MRYIFFALLFYLAFVLFHPQEGLGQLAHITDLAVGITMPALNEKQFKEENQFAEGVNTTDYAFSFNQQVLLGSHFAIGWHSAYLKNGLFIREVDQQGEIVSWDITHIPLGLLLVYYANPYQKSKDNWGWLLSTGAILEDIEEKSSKQSGDKTSLVSRNINNVIYYARPSLRYVIKTTDYSKINFTLSCYTTFPRFDLYLTFTVGLGIDIYYAK